MGKGCEGPCSPWRARRGPGVMGLGQACRLGAFVRIRAQSLDGLGGFGLHVLLVLLGGKAELPGNPSQLFPWFEAVVH